MLVDTHAHLQWDSFDKDLEQVVTRATRAGVKCIVNIGFDLKGCMKGIELAGKHKELYATVGIHPHNASQFSKSALDRLRGFSRNAKVVAIGEIGLDYYRNLSPRQVQKEAFEAQLDLAEELELPVVIHDRDAHDDTLKTLSKFRGKIRGVMHCFSGSREMAEQCVRSDFYVSLAGPVTFPNARKLHEIARWIDIHRLMLETDSPWLAPQQMRGRRNEPAFLPFIAEKVAELKRISLSELEESTTANAEEIFQLP